MRISCTALVLAGGLSLRMGEDKALICWAGQPLLRRVCYVASTVCSQGFIVTPWPDRYRHLVDPNWMFVPEVNQGGGPLIGFHTGLTALANQTSGSDWILLLACDLPLLDPEILQNWVIQLEDLSPDQLALVPRHDRGWEPLCAFYRPCCLENLSTFIQQNGRSFQAWLEDLNVQPISVSQQEKWMLSNCNTPADLAKLDLSAD